MNKKDFFALLCSNIPTVILLVEHLCGMALALECMIAWLIVSMLIHINILRDYVRVYVEEV